MHQAGAETRKDIMKVLYQRGHVLRPEDVVRPQSEPPSEFLEDMDVIYGPADEGLEEKAPEEDSFPPHGTREDFLYDPKQVDDTSFQTAIQRKLESASIHIAWCQTMRQSMDDALPHNPITTGDS
jgi:hypothetical protein